MTSTQKYMGYSLVPWKDSNEWHLVYSLIFEESHYSAALEMISLWKVRMRLIPSAVEGTANILEAIVSSKNEKFDEENWRILSSAAVMRFLNICVANRAQVFNFTKTAQGHKIPDWIINVRHDFAHNHKLPGRSLLQLALNKCLDWLKTNYWDVQSINIENHQLEASKSLDEYDELFPDEFYKMKEWTLKNIESVLCKTYINDSTKYKLMEDTIKNVPKLTKLIVKLTGIVYDEIEQESYRKSAAQWLDEIFRGLSNLKKPSVYPNQGIKFDRSTIKHLPELMDHKYTILKEFNNFSKYFYESYVCLVTGNKKLQEKHLEIVTSDRCENDFHNVFGDYKFSEEPKTVGAKRKRWTLEEDTSSYRTCPIGVLPQD